MTTMRVGNRSVVRVIAAYAAGFIIAATPTLAFAQTRLDSLRARFALPDVAQQILLMQSSFGVPAASFGSSTAFGASSGDLFGGAGYQQRTRYEVIGDGAVSAGFGLGNVKRLAAEVTITSFSTLRQGFVKNGSASLKLHRRLDVRTALAVGYENAVPWGGTDGGSSLYIVGSKLLPLSAEEGKPFGGIGVSLGVGNGRFRSESAVRSQRGGINVFGSASVRILKPVTLIADWTGQDLNAGLALQLPQRWPISMSVGFADITGNAGDGARLIAGAGAFLHRKRDSR